MNPATRTRSRLLVLAAMLVALFVVGRYTGVADDVDINVVREAIVSSGAWGGLLYVAIFAGGEFLHVPGMVFVAAGILVYGKLYGFAVALFASVVSVCVSFVVVRAVGGTPLVGAERPWLKRALARLEAQPVLTVFTLRLFLWLAPALNYALALTSVRFRHYLIGSALGLIVPVAGAALLFDWLLTLMSP